MRLIAPGVFVVAALSAILGVTAQAGVTTQQPKWKTIDRIERPISPERIEVSGNRRNLRSLRVLVSSTPPGLPVNGTKITDCTKAGERRFRARHMFLETPGSRHITLTFAAPDRCTITVEARVKRSVAPERGTLRLVLQAQTKEA
jgi:hypothetical protein